MPKNIVICSDGTGNSFSEQRSSISLLIRLLEVGEPQAQHVFYDQGLGTNPKRVKKATAYKLQLNGNGNGLTILPPPQKRLWLPGAFGRWAGLAFGYGLRENVKEMYKV